MLREGNGAELVSTIQKTPRAIVFVSVPWSGPERNGREVFRAAVAQLTKEHPELGVSFFRLDVDEDKISQEWLASIGQLQLADVGAGSLLWLQSGEVMSAEINSSSLGMQGIVDRTMSQWSRA